MPGGHIAFWQRNMWKRHTQRCSEALTRAAHNLHGDGVVLVEGVGAGEGCGRATHRLPGNDFIIAAASMKNNSVSA